jgi:hypothetical protein
MITAIVARVKSKTGFVTAEAASANPRLDSNHENVQLIRRLKIVAAASALFMLKMKSPMNPMLGCKPLVLKTYSPPERGIAIPSQPKFIDQNTLRIQSRIKAMTGFVPGNSPTAGVTIIRENTIVAFHVIANASNQENSRTRPVASLMKTPGFFSNGLRSNIGLGQR